MNTNDLFEQYEDTYDEHCTQSFTEKENGSF